jgi:hypothetical protein
VSIARVHATVIAPTTLAATRRVPLAVEGLADWRVQYVQGSAGGTATATVYGSVLDLDDPLLDDTDPATNMHWEDTGLVLDPPGSAGSHSVAEENNSWSTILVEIDVAVAVPDFAVYFFGKER